MRMDQNKIGELGKTTYADENMMHNMMRQRHNDGTEKRQQKGGSAPARNGNELASMLLIEAVGPGTQVLT